MTAIRMPNTAAPAHQADAAIGEWIYLLMRRGRLTQTVLAERLGITQTAVGNKLRGRRPWLLDELVIVADMLGTDLPSLFSGLPGLDSNQQHSGYPLVLVRTGLADVIPIARARRGCAA